MLSSVAKLGLDLKTPDSLTTRKAAPPRVVKATRGTGIWPFVRPRPWNLESTDDEAVLVDPVAVAAAASENLSKAGWPGISLMSVEFQMSLVDKSICFVEKEVENWYNANRAAVANELGRRLATYNIDTLSVTARTAVKEAIGCYIDERYLSVVRVLMPEFETFGRSVYTGTSTAPTQRQAIDSLKGTIDSLPVSGTDAIESFSLHHFIEDKLFARCFSVVDAGALGTFPNRHAELHGLATYGNLKGATTLLCVMGLLLQLMDRFLVLTNPHMSAPDVEA